MTATVRGEILLRDEVDAPPRGAGDDDDDASSASGAAPAPAPAFRGLRTLGGSRRRVRPCDGGGDWPPRTDTWCWHCCHPFDGPPLPLPFKYDAARDEFHVKGTFCSWACMKAYNMESGTYLKNVTATVITLFKKRCTGRLEPTRSAPPRVALRAFGGSMSIDEFRAASGGSKDHRLLPPRMILHAQALEEHDRRADRRRPDPAALAACVSFKNVSTKNEPLRLKRPKPLQSNKNTLLRTMGLQVLGSV